MNRYRAYPEYKPSEIAWLGQVPSHWKKVPIKALASWHGGLFIDGDWIESKNLSLSGIRYITTGNVGEGEYREQGTGYISEDTFLELKCTEVLQGDVLLSRLNPPIGRACIAPDLGQKVVTSVDNVILRPAPEYLPQYLVYRFSGNDYFYETNSLAGGATMQRISRTELGNLRLAFPPLPEQKKIVRVLDREITRIDALMSKKIRFIELLDEKRQALIMRAVTKGLDPNVKMKGSGIDWIGDVPDDWGIAPIRRVAKLESGHTPSRAVPAYWEHCTIPWFTLADVWQIRKEGRVVVSETAEMVSKLGIENSSARKLPPGTVILSRTASVGFPAIMGCEMATSQDFAAWICGDKINNLFLYLCLRAMAAELQRLTMGSTHKTIYMPDIEQLKCPLPPIQEQIRISAAVRAQLARIHSLDALMERSIAGLRERRSAFITAAVTGQIDLRGAI